MVGGYWSLNRRAGRAPDAPPVYSLGTHLLPQGWTLDRFRQEGKGTWGDLKSPNGLEFKVRDRREFDRDAHRWAFPREVFETVTAVMWPCL